MPPQYEEEPAADDPLAALAAAADGDAPMADMPTEEILSQLSADDQAPRDNELARAAAAMNQGSSDEESPALPWTSVDQESESDDSQSSDAQDDSASQEQSQPAARPAAPESAAQPGEAAEPESKPPQPEAASDDASEQADDSPDTTAGLAAAAAAASVAAASTIQPKPQPAPAAPKAIPLGHGSSFRSTMARPQPVPTPAADTGNAMASRGPQAARPQPQVQPQVAADRGVNPPAPASQPLPMAAAIPVPAPSAAPAVGVSDFNRPRPLYRGLKLAAGVLRVVALLLLAVTVLQALSWQQTSLVQTLGDSGEKLVYILRVAVPLALGAMTWGIAECCAGLRTLLRQ